MPEVAITNGGATKNRKPGDGYGKITAAGVAGALVTIAGFGYQWVTGKTVDPGLTAAITTLVTAAAVYVIPHDSL